MARAGNLLETTVKKIFDLAGFRTKQDVKIKGYEIDVLAKYEGYTIAIECKERSSGGLIVRNLIHEWSGKNKIINADKVVLAIYGVSIRHEDLKLAKDNGIILWSEKDIEKFLDSAYEKKGEILVDILDNLNITTKDVIERRKGMEKYWTPNFYLIERKKPAVFNPLTATSNLRAFFICGDKAIENELTYPELDFQTKRKILNDADFRINRLEERIVAINSVEDNPIDTILIPFDIGQEELKLSEKHNIRCLVSKNIKHVSKGLLHKEPAIDVEKTKIIILTEEILKNQGSLLINRFCLTNLLVEKGFTIKEIAEIWEVSEDMARLYVEQRKKFNIGEGIDLKEVYKNPKIIFKIIVKLMNTGQKVDNETIKRTLKEEYESGRVTDNELKELKNLGMLKIGFICSNCHANFNSLEEAEKHGKKCKKKN